MLCGCGAIKEEANVKERAPRECIGDLACEVTQNAATERVFTGKYDDFFKKWPTPSFAGKSRENAGRCPGSGRTASRTPVTGTR